MTTRRPRFRKHANPFNIRGPETMPNWSQIFARSAPMALDIGFGSGTFLTALAKSHPEWNCLGFEIRRHLVEHVLELSRSLGLTNVFAMVANANLDLTHLAPPQSLVFVSINFPDPWFKKRHHKRRVISHELLDIVADKLLPLADLHIMTDYEPIGMAAALALREHRAFVSMHPELLFVPFSTTGIPTHEEMKHLQRNEQIYRLHYQRRVY